jgi:molybdopterin/thiamine biosynthesis adenylyltransferase
MNIIKHLKVFNPTEINLHNKRAVVIGCGSVGSVVALQIAKLGIKNITLIDDDEIEEHNIPNQILFGPQDVGMYKSELLSEKIYELTGIKPDFVFDKLCAENKHLINNVDFVFVCVDSMRAREEIFRLTFAKNFAFYGECRVSARSGAAYAISPLASKHRREYETTLYSEDEVLSEAGSCGTVPSIGPTASLAANYLVWMFMKWAETNFDKGPFEIMFSADPLFLTSRELPPFKEI